jgi:hypothetical protein
MNTLNSDTDDMGMNDMPDQDNDSETPVTSKESTHKKKKTPDTSHSDLADASIGQMLNSLLEKVFATQDLSELNTIATILQRLIASSQQVLSLRGQIQEAGTAADSSPEKGLDRSVVRQLERQLGLL